MKKTAAQRGIEVRRVLRLYSIRALEKADCGFPVISVACRRCRETPCSVFSIEGHFPKLNVAGSIPVSRSNQIN